MKEIALLHQKVYLFYISFSLEVMDGMETVEEI